MPLTASASPSSYRRQRTKAVDTQDLDVLVLSYSQHDSSGLTYLGKHALETRWKIVVGTRSAPVDIVVTVDKKVAATPEVSVEIDGETVRKKATLPGDFCWEIPFRANIKGIGRKKYYEIRPSTMSREMWIKAVITKQCDGGWFWATGEMPDGKGGIKEVHFPAITADNIRETHGEKRALFLPKRSLTLCVPKSEPMHATLSTEGGELLTHFFGRYTPTPSVSMKESTWLRSLTTPSTKLVVKKDRSTVTTEVCHEFLSQFIAGTVFGISQQARSATEHSWTMRIGPTAEHKIEIHKTSKSSKAVSLLIDGDLLAETTAEDLESPEGQWVCEFKFVGQRCLEWEVYESDGNGNALDTKNIVRQPFSTSVQCMIIFDESVHDLSSARLIVNQKDFTELPEPKDGKLTGGMCLQPEALFACYSLTVPYRCSSEPPSFKPLDMIAQGISSFNNLLRCCYCQGATSQGTYTEIHTKEVLTKEITPETLFSSDSGPQQEVKRES